MRVWIETLPLLRVEQYLANPGVTDAAFGLQAHRSRFAQSSTSLVAAGWSPCLAWPCAFPHHGHNLEAVTSHGVFIQLLGWRPRVPTDVQNTDVPRG